jgi:DNA-binding MarR family transcriptional regulator
MSAQSANLQDMPDHHFTQLEEDAWDGFLHTHSALWKELEARMLRAHGLLLSSYDVLLKINQAGAGGVRMSELARQALMTTGGLTRLADRLERDGLITRTRSAEDGRGFVACITPAGRRLLSRARRDHVRDVRELVLDRLDEAHLRALAESWDHLR